LLPVVTAYVLYSAPVPEGAALGGVTQPPAVAAGFTLPVPAQSTWATVWQSWAVPVWSLGVLLFSVRLVWGCREVSMMRRRGTPAQVSIVANVQALAARLGITRPISVLMTSAEDGPSVVGWIRPVVLLPAATLIGLTTAQLEAVLAHEVAHIRRHDYLVNLGQILLETVLFYHPAVWWISARIRRERELCCDDLAVQACGDAVCYARALTKLERLRLSAPSLAMGSTDGPLMYRIQRLLGAGSHERPSKLPGILALSLGLACFAIHLHWAKGQQRHNPEVSVEERSNVRDGAGVNVDLGGAPVLHRSSVEYPRAAVEKNIQGSVTVEATLDADGAVNDARVVSGPTELRRAALQSVLEWHFIPGANGSVRQVTIHFEAAAAKRAEVEDSQRHDIAVRTEAGETRLHVMNDRGEKRAFAFTTRPDELARQQELLQSRAELEERTSILEKELAARAQDKVQTDAAGWELREQQRQLERETVAAREQLNALAEVIADRSPADATRKVGRIVFRGYSNEAGQALTSRLPIHLGDTVTEQLLENLAAAIQKIDQHPEARPNYRLIPEPDGTVTLFLSRPHWEMSLDAVQK
jgi:TonB family protein